MKRYGYHRTSTKEQHLDRGILEITKYCSDNNLELEKIFTDQMTGKNFNRPIIDRWKERGENHNGDSLKYWKMVSGRHIVLKIARHVKESKICILTDLSYRNIKKELIRV